MLIISVLHTLLIDNLILLQDLNPFSLVLHVTPNYMQIIINLVDHISMAYYAWN